MPAGAADDFAVGADVEQQVRLLALIQAGGDDAGEQVTADEAAQAGEEQGGARPLEISGGEGGGGQMRRFKGDGGQR
jgi:hypothetical protein